MDSHSLLPSSIVPHAYATANLSHATSAHYELPTNQTCTYPHELPEAYCLSNPLACSTSAAPPRKRRAISDLTEEFSQFDGWKLNDDILLDVHSLPQLINGDPLHDLALFNDNHAPNLSLNDLEDVLNFLWMEDDTASITQSASSTLASSDQFSLISDLDWDYGTNESSSNQGESTDNPSSDDLQILQVKQEGVIGASSNKVGSPTYNWESWQEEESHSGEIWATWQHQKHEATRASWQEKQMASLQQKKQGEVRASWQDKTRASWQEETRASWQLKQEGARASWQPKQGGIRASWQQKEEGENRASWQAPEGRCKQERVEGAVSASEKLSVDACGAALRSPRNGAWAGPTLLDIESALALNYGSPNTSPLSSFSPIASPTPLSTPKHSISSLFDVKKLLSDDLAKCTGEQDSLGGSWRLKLQKRNSLEPKYTVKVESEEKALGDGYRWRKYGQKTIKNSPFPRSYYRCSSGKCNAKKQVEKCQEDGGGFLVNYEGIHLHHRPNPLHKFRTLGDLHEDEKEKSPSDLCSPSSSTSCSYSIPPICSRSSLNHTLLTSS